MQHSALRMAGLCFTCVMGLLAVGTTASRAHQKQLVKFEAPAANTKYTEQHSISVSDVSGHDIRIFENLQTFPKDPLIIGEVRASKNGGRTASPTTTRPMGWAAYHTLLIANGNKIFISVNFVSQSAGGQDGSKKGASNPIAGPIVCGTGKFLGLRGLLRLAATLDTKSGFNESKSEIEYWTEK